MEDNTHQNALIEHAQSVLTDERHWTQTDVADRADNASGLAEHILRFFDVNEGSCKDKCEECQAHEQELG